MELLGVEWGSSLWVSVPYRTLAYVSSQFYSNCIQLLIEYAGIFRQKVNFVALYGQQSGTVVEDIMSHIDEYLASGGG